MNTDDSDTTETASTVANEGKRRGRPRKDSEKLESVNLTLPPALIRDLQREQKAQGLDSLSAVARIGLGEWVRRVAKRAHRGN